MRRRLDDVLFTSGPWFAIDAANVAVRGVRPATLSQALALVGQGRVASVVGTLRDGVVGVDIDSATFAGEILDALCSFCDVHGLAYVVRPSGGADGRAHLILVPGAHRQDFEDLVSRLRRELGRKADPVTGRRAVPLNRHHVDVRRQLRPLSAPHRCKPTPVLDRDVLAVALVSLSEALQAVSPRIQEARVDNSTPATSRAGSRRVLRAGGCGSVGAGEPLTALPRPWRELPAGWAAYVRRGRVGATEAGLDRDPGTRSTIEYDATRAMVVAGWSEEQAWQAIRTAHRGAFVKARSQGRRWWWNVWNPAVVDADAWLSEQRAAAAGNGTNATSSAADDDVNGGDGAVARVIARAYAELETVWRSWPAQARHTRRELCLYVLERMRRCGATAIALPQRDVLLDTAIESRNTVAAARDALTAGGLLEVESTHVRGTVDTADTWRLPARFVTTEPPTASPSPEQEGRGVGSFEPTRVTPPRPTPRLPLPLRRSLGLPRAHLLEVVRVHASAASLATLAYEAGISTTLFAPDTADQGPAVDPVLTCDQERTVRGHLQVLAACQLVAVDADGCWRAVERSPAVGAAATGSDIDVDREHAALEQRGRDRQETIRAAVATERHEYRAVVDPIARRHRWLAQRQQALARQAKVDLGRQKAWWDGLDIDSGRVRTAAAGAVFDALSPTQQAERKTQLAARRTLAGIVERDRYTTWWDGLSSAQRDQRSITRAWAYHRLPQHTQVELAGAWNQHRTRWGLPLSRRTSPPPQLPNVHDQTVDSVIDLSPPGLEQVDLLDLLTADAVVTVQVLAGV